VFGEFRPNRVLNGEIGVGDRRAVRFALDSQVSGPESVHGDGIGSIREAQCQLNIGMGD
jgi:hypothetical protein